MGEAAPCLMRSVSQPFFASCEFKEGDPLRALTTSVSFGRFMTESLDWEKWSSFSHNRTLEDVQKHSRPGAVAEKKAFFEAHYKKIASKKATKSPQKENTPPNHSPQTNISPPRSDTHSAINEIQENESSTYVISPPRSDTHSAINELQENESSTYVISPPRSDTHSAINELQENESSEPITSPSFSHINEKEDIASCKDVCTPSTNLVITQVGNFEDDVASSCQVEQEKGSPENVSSKKHRFYKRNKSPEICSSKNEGSRKAPTLPICPKKTPRDVKEKKRSALQSLHMSMNFIPKIGNLKTISKPKDKLIQQPLNLKVSVNGVKKNSQVLPAPEMRSHLNAASVCTKKPRSSSTTTTTTVSSSFSFRSEERAAKRKEFFQKLEEKGNNTKETQKINPQPKSKAINDNKKLRRGTTLEEKPCTKETKIPSSMQKVPPMQPSSPKLGRKPTLRSVQESWRALKPKNFIEINKKNLTTISMASLPIKKISKK